MSDLFTLGNDAVGFHFGVMLVMCFGLFAEFRLAFADTGVRVLTRFRYFLFALVVVFDCW